MKKYRLITLVGALGVVALTGAMGAEGAVGKPRVETFCLCGCLDGTTMTVPSNSGDCAAACVLWESICPPL